MSQTRSVDALLTERIGLDPQSVGSSLIVRGLEARMSALGLSDPNEYERHLVGSGEELQSLIEEVVVPESWFFRDGRPFAFLQEHVRSNWLIDSRRPPLRVLSLPCAGGEEPYSIALALQEAGLPLGRFHIDAVDLSVRSLARARQAIYGRNSFRGGDLGFRARSFQEQDGRYHLDPAVRNSVRLIQGNILDPGLLADEPPYDVLFCRNLLIYFTQEARAQASANLSRLLAGSGVLFLGHAERLDLAGMRLTPAGDGGTFAYLRAPNALPAPARIKALEPPTQSRLALTSVAKRTWPAPRPPRPESIAPSANGQPQTVDDPLAVPGKSGRQAIDQALGNSPLLDQAIEQADQGRYAEAVALCEQSMRESGHSARAYFLLGMIRQAAGDRDAAEAALRKAVYLDAQHDEALLALALLAQRRGDAASATSYRRRAERALARKGTP